MEHFYDATPNPQKNRIQYRDTLRIRFTNTINQETVQTRIPPVMLNALYDLASARRKITAIKLLREYFSQDGSLGMGLKEAKDIVEHILDNYETGYPTEASLGDILQAAIRATTNLRN